MSFASPTAAAVVIAVAWALRPSVAPAQSRAAADYVLLASDSLSADRLSVTDGDIAVLAGPFTARRTLVAPASAVAAPSVRLASGTACEVLFASSARGSSPACGPAHAFTEPFASVAEACDFPDPFPSCDPLRPPVIVPHGATVALPPGVYGDVRVEGGAGGPGSLRLSGNYAFCNVRALRAAAIQFTGPSELFVAGTLAAGNGAQLRPAPLSGVSASQIHVFVGGALVRFTRQAAVRAQLCAPRATLRLGSNVDVEGRLAAADIRLRRSVVSLPAGSGAGTTTTTTTTTLAPPARCGNGVVDPGEVCDGNVACTSPGGSFLTCSACAAFTSGPCAATTTTLPAAAPRCGDGVVDPGEQCDDGNTTDCDGCSARCTREVVGNGVLDCDEECDDGNTTDCDGCNADGEIECGNGVIDSECGEVCDGADVAEQTCPGGVVTCAADCRSVDRTRCPATAAAPREICGNCIDDDLNGLVDFEDPACCANPAAGKLVKARLRARKSGRTLLRLRGALGGKDLAVSPSTQNVFLQVRTQPGGELLCAEVPAGRFKSHRKAFRFRDRGHAVPSAQALDLIRLRRTAHGALRAHAVGRAMQLDMPNAGAVRVTVGFADPTDDPGGNRCAVMTAPLRAARAGGLRSP
jgi:cysteine-rich repeat protein